MWVMWGVVWKFPKWVSAENCAKRISYTCGSASGITFSLGPLGQKRGRLYLSTMDIRFRESSTWELGFKIY